MALNTATSTEAPADASPENGAAPLSDDEALLAAFGGIEVGTPEGDDADAGDDIDESTENPFGEPSEDESSDVAPPAPAPPDPEEEKRAGLRLEDYTRKTMEVAEKARQTEALRVQYAERLEYLAQMIDANAQEPNWDELRVTMTSEELNDAYREWGIADRKRQQVRVELDRERARTQEQMSVAMREQAVQEIARLRAVLPEGKDDATFTTRIKTLTQYGTTIGFTPDELSAVTDHRAIVLLDKAERYDALVAKAKQRGKTAPANASPVQTAKPTRAVPENGQWAAQTVQDKLLFAKLKKTGDAKMAEELFFRGLRG